MRRSGTGEGEVFGGVGGDSRGLLLTSVVSVMNLQPR